MREFTAGGNGGVGGILKFGIIVFESGHSCFALQTGNGNVFVMYIQVRDFLIGPGAEASDSGDLFFD